jgi:hypothetical protein
MMNKSPASFKQIDVTRAARGALAAGLSVGRVEISRDGKIVVIVENSRSAEPNDWD